VLFIKETHKNYSLKITFLARKNSLKNPEKVLQFYPLTRTRNLIRCMLHRLFDSIIHVFLRGKIL